MIKVDTDALLSAAEEILAMVETIEKNTEIIVNEARNTREKQRTLFVFKKTQKDIEMLERDTAAAVVAMRNQSLYLKECAKRFRAVQGVTQVTVRMM